jgi:hypothetical protein
VATVKNKTVKEALEHVAKNPPEGFEPTVDKPAWELVCQVLFIHANGADPRIRGSVGRATRAQKLIFNRLTGRRRPGTHPAQVQAEEIDFVDLTVGVLDANSVSAEEEEAADE